MNDTKTTEVTWRDLGNDMDGTLAGQGKARFLLNPLSHSRLWQATDLSFPGDYYGRHGRVFVDYDHKVCVAWCERQAAEFPTISWRDHTEGREGWVGEKQRFLVTQSKDARVTATDLFGEVECTDQITFQDGITWCYDRLRAESGWARKGEPPSRAEGPKVRGGTRTDGRVPWSPLPADDPVALLVGGRAPAGCVWEYVFGKYAYRMQHDVPRAMITPCPEVQKWAVTFGWPYCETYLRDTLRESVELALELMPPAGER